MEYIDAEVIEPLNDLDSLISNSNKKKLVFRIGCLSMIFLWLFLIFLYFILPAYRLESVKIHGLSNLTESDVLALGGYSTRTHILGINNKTFEKNLINKSNDLILKVDANISAFSSEISIIEDMPIFNYENKIFFLSLSDKDNYIQRVKDNLPGERALSVIAKINEDTNDITNLIDLHLLEKFNSVTKINDEVKKAINPFLGISFDTLKYISSIQYTSYFDTLNVYSLCDALIEYNSFKVVLKSIRYDTILDVFNSPESIQTIINNAKEMSQNEVTKNRMNLVDYKFLDEDKIVKDVYELHVSVNNHHVRIYIN